MFKCTPTTNQLLYSDKIYNTTEDLQELFQMTKLIVNSKCTVFYQRTLPSFFSYSWWQTVETLQDIILGDAAGALCFHCEFRADSQAQGCQVEVRNNRNSEVEQSFILSRRSLLMTCARGLRMESTEYVVIAREIEVSGKIGTEVIRHWDPLLLPPPPPSPPSLSTTEPALTSMHRI